MAVPHAPMQEVSAPYKAYKYHAPIPILLEIPLFSNTESGDLGPCACTYCGVGKIPAPLILFIPAVQ